MTVQMVKVKLNKRLLCDGKFRMDNYEGTMDANRANYLSGLGEVEILGNATKKRSKPKAQTEPKSGDRNEPLGSGNGNATDQED